MDTSVDTTRYKEMRKAATIMEEPGDGLHEEQKHGRRYICLAFGSGWTAV